MDTIKKYGLLGGKFLLCFLIGSIILSIFNYFLFSSKISHTIGFIYLLLIVIILSFQTAKKSDSRGIITGLKNGFLFIFILFLINIILYQSPFKFLRIVYYLILLFASILGAIAGVNNKPKNN